MQAQMIRPHTTPPVARAAIHDPFHSVWTMSPCLLTDSGMPPRAHSSVLQAVAVTSNSAKAAARGTTRRANGRRLVRRVGLTDRLPHRYSPEACPGRPFTSSELGWGTH